MTLGGDECSYHTAELHRTVTGHFHGGVVPRVSAGLLAA